MDTFLDRYKYALVLAGILVVYICNLFVNVMDVDASQYASISMEMAQNKSYLEVYHLEHDYLDKPPLLFWLSASSMSLFGIGNVAYKLPSVLLALLGIFSTYKFAQLYYSKKVATYAALMLASSQALFLITNDLRTDTNLLVFVIFSVWQLALFVRNKNWLNFFLGFTGVALAMMAKGPIGIVTIAMALGTDFLLKKEWKLIFNWRWLIGLVWVAILLIPMTWGLYSQFDLHPEKSAYGIDSPSGVKFFYWTQSFGRITGESEWDNGAGFFFFFHSILWDFQPWVLYFVLGLIAVVRIYIKGGLSAQKEFMTLGGFVLTFLALSLSKYKLPHYIFVTFPFAAIIAANYLLSLKKKTMLFVQAFFNVLFWFVCALGMVYVFPSGNVFLAIVLLLLCAGSWWAFFKGKSISARIFFSAVITAIGFNLMMASHFYPSLIGGYQAPGIAGELARENGKGEGEFYYYSSHSHSLDFYYNNLVPKVPNLFLNMQKGDWVYTDQVGKDYVESHQLDFHVAHKIPSYRVTILTMDFIRPETRGNVVDTMYIFEKD
ncbi:glycosyltransferase family 39 protein [Crocinitomicaceae bacterium]|nr:glycosyltransferase family 39 protein [Crocinitomicaceae bacterium]